jgi:membrane protease YdiL (CAAX protease family)
MLFMVCAFFARSWFQLYLRDAGFNASLTYDLSFFVMLPIVTILMYPILRDNVTAMRQWLRPPESWWRLIAFSVLIGVLLRVIFWAYHTAGAAFGWLYDESYPVIPSPQFNFSCPEPTLLALKILVLATLTPVFEELFHRGFILHALLPRGQSLAIVLSAVLFGVMHKPDSIAMAFLIGLPLAVLAMSLRALWAPIITHATFNLAAIVDWNCLNPNWNPAATSPYLTVIGCVSIAVVLISLVSVFLLLRYAKTGAQIAPRLRPSDIY